jgi:4-amino-4-deoxy-L-arabinose transferase-like glycosyltransferase
MTETASCNLRKSKTAKRFYQWTDMSLFLLVAVLAAITFFPYLGNLPLFNPDEGLYAEPAREMLDTGEYITTLLNYVVRFTKPPLVIWAMALSYKIFGVNEFAARFCCASAGFLLILVTYLFAWKYLGRKVAIVAVCTLITAPLFVGVGHMAITDMPLSLFMAGSLFAFFHAWQQKQQFWLWVGYIGIALAIMTKGPVGLLLPGVILGAYFFLCARNKKVISFLRLGWGSLIMAIIALPWFVVEIAITHGAYFREFILRENFARFTTVVDAHKGAWWYHLAAVFGGLFPWSILLPPAAVTFAKTLMNNSFAAETEQSKDSDSKLLFWRVKKLLFDGCQRLSLQNETLLFLYLCSAITIIFFSASVSKLLPYTLPAFPALAIIIAYQWQTFMEAKTNKAMLTYCSVIFCLFAGAAAYAPLALKYLRGAPPDLAGTLISSVSILSLFFLLASCLAFVKLRSQSLFVLLASTIVFSFVMTPKILSQVSLTWEGAIVDYARFARNAGGPLVIYQLRKPAIPFYFGSRVFQVGNVDGLQDLPGRYYLITGCKNVEFFKTRGCKIIAQDTHFALLFFSRV